MAEDFDFLSAEEELQEPKLSIDDWIDKYINLDKFEQNVKRSYAEVIGNFEDYMAEPGYLANYTLVALGGWGYTRCKTLIQDYEIADYYDIEPEDLARLENVEEEDFYDLLEWYVEPFFDKVVEKLEKRITMYSEEGYAWWIWAGYDHNGDYGFILAVERDEDLVEEEEE